MSTYLELFYAKRLGNFIHLYLHFFVSEVFCPCLYDIRYFYLIQIICNWCIWPINRTLTGITTPGQRGTESLVNEGILYFLQLHHLMQFIVIPKIPLLVTGEVLLLCKGYTQCILRPAWPLSFLHQKIQHCTQKIM